MIEKTSAFAWRRPALNHLNVLVAQDNADNSTFTRFVLTGAGARVKIAKNGAEAILLAKRRDFDAILMDLQTPHVNGFEATAKIRKFGYRGPIIALTACAKTDERAACMAGGFTEYVTRDARRSTLVDAIVRLTPRGDPLKRSNIG